MRSRRLLIRIPLLAALAGVGACIVAYIFGIAWLQASYHSHYRPSDLWSARSIDVVLFLWSFWFGSAIGSFLNVVAWRMPRGEGVGGRSHCPRCFDQLRARDNFPVFGWIALRGRCRTCRLPISPRYPIVEAAVGLSLTLVAIGQLYQFSLPGQSRHWHGGPMWAPLIDGSVLATLAYHVVAVSVCWAMGLIRLDRHRLPDRLIQCGLAIVVLPILVYPPLMIVSWQVKQFSPTPDWTGVSLYVDGAVRVLTAMAAAAMIGRSLARAFCPSADPKLDPLGKSTRRLMDLIVIVAVPSIVLGWQAIPAVTVIASLIAVLIRRWIVTTTDGLGAFALAMPIALTIQIVGWRILSDQTWWPSSQSQPLIFLGWAAAVLLVPIWLRDRDHSFGRGRS